WRSVAFLPINSSAAAAAFLRRCIRCETKVSFGVIEMNRADFHKLTEIRMREAKVLLARKCYEGAYYLAGYAVECALKACIAKRTQAHDFPPKPDLVRSFYQ